MENITSMVITDWRLSLKNDLRGFFGYHSYPLYFAENFPDCIIYNTWKVLKKCNPAPSLPMLVACTQIFFICKYGNVLIYGVELLSSKYNCGKLPFVIKRNWTKKTPQKIMWWQFIWDAKLDGLLTTLDQQVYHIVHV